MKDKDFEKLLEIKNEIMEALQEGINLKPEKPEPDMEDIVGDRAFELGQI